MDLSEQGQPQVRSKMTVVKDEFTVEVDVSSNLGGWGTKPIKLTIEVVRE